MVRGYSTRRKASRRRMGAKRRRGRAASYEARFRGISQALHPVRRVEEPTGSWRSLSMADSQALLPSAQTVFPAQVVGDEATGMRIAGGNTTQSSRLLARASKTAISAQGVDMTINDGPLALALDLDERPQGFYLECYRPMLYEPRLMREVLGEVKSSTQGYDIGARTARHLFDVIWSVKVRLVLHPGRYGAAEQGPDGDNGWVHHGVNKQPAVYTDPVGVRVLGVIALDMGDGTGRDNDIGQSTVNPQKHSQGDKAGTDFEKDPQFYITFPTENDIFDDYGHASMQGKKLFANTDEAHEGTRGIVPVPTAEGALGGLTYEGRDCFANRRLFEYGYKRKKQTQPYATGQPQGREDNGRHRKFNVVVDKKIVFGPPSVTTGGRIATDGARVWTGVIKVKMGRITMPDGNSSEVKIPGASKRSALYFMPTLSSYMNGIRLGDPNWMGSETERTGTTPGSGHHDISVQLSDEKVSYKEWNANGMVG